MMTLSTVPVVADDEVVRVHWTTGLRNNGVVDVELGADVEDRSVVAELIAIRFLVFDKLVFGRRPVSGKGYELRIHSGAIRKVLQRRSTKKNLIGFCMFLSGPFDGVTLTVMKQRETDRIFGTAETWQADRVDGTDPENKVPQEKWETAIGELYITKHAVEQFAKRLNATNDAEMTNPMSSLLRALNPTKGSLERVLLNEDVMERKDRKYGPHDDATHWRNTESGFVFTVLNSDGDRPGTLVTCFYRTGNFAEPAK